MPRTNPRSSYVYLILLIVTAVTSLLVFVAPRYGFFIVPSVQILRVPVVVPLSVPVGVPIGVPFQVPVGNPVGVPIGVPVAVPVGNPVGVPVAVPVGNPVGVPIGVPVAVPVGNPVGVPVAVPVPPSVDSQEPDFSKLSICSFPQADPAQLPSFTAPEISQMPTFVPPMPLVCKDFFTVIPESDACTLLTGRKVPLLTTMGAQMVAMGTNLSIYTHVPCPDFSPPPGVQHVLFNLTEVFSSAGFNETHIDLYQRLAILPYKSDVLRIVLQLLTRKSYVDTDVLFVSLDRNLFFGEYQAGCFWEDAPAGQIEITNAAFCHKPSTLRTILWAQLSSMMKYNASVPVYTGMASVMMLRGAATNAFGRLILQNHPLIADQDNLVQQMIWRNVTQLHLTTALQGGMKNGYAAFAASLFHSYCTNPALQQQWTFKSFS